MLRSKSNPRTPKAARGRALVALLALACLASLAASALVSTRAHAQQPANQNTPPARTKRITPLRTSDGAQGSRVTITSDGELNDYKAYRSGDRFIVVIPQAQGGGGEGARGRGFDGAQVSRQGNDLVYTFKLAPGASARVNQRFNRLDVQFTAPASAGAQATPAPTPRGAIETSGIRQTPTPAAQPETNARTNPSGTVGPPSTAQTPNATTGAATGATTGTAASNPNGATNPGEVSPPLTITPAQSPVTEPSAAPSASPGVAQSSTDQIAQSQTQQPAPVNVVSQTPAASGSTLGTFIARNIPWIIIAMIGIGVVFLLVARFGERQPVEPLPPALEESSALKARTAKAEGLAELEPSTHDDEATLVSATTATTPTAARAATLAATEPAPAKSKKGKRRKEERRAAKRAAEAGAAQAAGSANTTAPAATPAKQATPSTAAPASEAVKGGVAATASTEKSDEAALAPEAALVAAPVVAASVVGARAGGKGSEEKKAGEKEEAATASAPADTERVGEEIRKLLAGESYDESVVGAGDAATRELVASELSAALASRQPSRNQRAREAFMRHGYFEEAARHLQSAEAPAQRASAAHSLSLVRDRAATPHLVAALEDPSPEVRRASVEALAALRDPAALEPLEALRWRETSRQVPRSLIMRAIEASTPDEVTVLTRGPEAAKIENEPAKVEAESEKIETAAAEAKPAEEGATETPAVETPAAEAQAVEAPAAETTTGAATIEAAAVEVPAAQDAASETEAEARTAEAETVQAPAAESSLVESPAAESPAAQSSVVEAPPAEASPVAEQATEAAHVEAAAVELSADTGFASTPSTEARAATHTTAEATTAEPAKAEQPALETAAAPSLFAEETRSEGAPAELASAEVEREATKAGEVEPVYTFDETRAAAWSAPRAEDDAAHASRRGTGGLDARAVTGPEAPTAAGEPADVRGPQVYSAPEFAVAEEPRGAEGEGDDWIDLSVEEQHVSDMGELTPAGAGAVDHSLAFEKTHDAAAEAAPALSAEPGAAGETQSSAARPGDEHAHAIPVEPILHAEPVAYEEKGIEIITPPHAAHEKGIEIADAPPSAFPKSIQLRLESEDVGERAASVRALARLSTGEAFQQICAAFDDPSVDVRNAAARALYDVSEDRADTFTRALRESPPERRRKIGASLSTSGLADEAVSQLTGESRERTYDAFSLLFLMAKAGETAPLIRAIESHPDTEVRLAVVKLLALSGQQEVLPSFKRLAVRGSLPNEVRSAVMEAIYQISSAGAQPTRP